MTRLNRRQLLAATAGIIGSTLLPWPARSAAKPADFAFMAYRDGAPLGHHRVRFTPEVDRLVIEIEIVFDVKLAFIPLYRYRHHNRELWADGRLVELAARTDDNGTNYWVEARAVGDQLIVDGSSGRLTLPGDTPSTSYWNETTMRRDSWLDTQYGRIARSTVTAKPPESVRIGVVMVQAQPYVLAGDIDCELWYHDGSWVKLRFAASDGSVIDYALDSKSVTG